LKEKFFNWDFLLEKVVIITTCIVILPLPLDWNEFKFIILAFVAFIFLCIVKLKKTSLRIFLHRSDLFLLALITLGATSSLWSTDSSLHWPFTFRWILMFFWLLMFRSLSSNKDWINLFIRSIEIVFYISSIYIIFILSFNTKEINWSILFGNNKNHISSLLLLIFPLFFQASETRNYVRYRKFLGLLLLSTVAILAQCKGVFLCLFLVLFFKAIKFNIKLTLSITLLLIMLYFISFYYLTDYYFSFSIFEDSARQHIISEGINTFTQHPFFGYGLGNWSNAVYTTNIGSHNFYLLLLVELGALGLVIYLLFVFVILLNHIKYVKSTGDKNSNAFIYSIIFFLVLSLFYNISNSDQHNFSLSQFLFFCIVGLITQEDKKQINKKVYSTFLSFLIIIGSLTLTWYSSVRYYNQIYRKARSEISTNPTESIKLLKQCYNPIFRTKLFRSNSIPLQLANLYLKEGDLDLANFYFNICSNICPNDIEYLTSYSSYLYFNKNDTLEALSLVQKADSYNINNLELKLLIIKFDIDHGNYDAARDKLKKLNPSLPYYKRKILSLKKQMK